jgi:hypothetical protein
MDGEDIVFLGFTGALVVALLIAIGLMTTAVTADHRVRRYYIGTPMSSHELGLTCVYGDEPWEGDSRVFCSMDPEKTLDFTRKANAAIAGTK